MLYRIYRNKNSILATYNINDQALTRREQVNDLGVIFKEGLEIYVLHIQGDLKH